jgi:hypothetical protein
MIDVLFEALLTFGCGSVVPAAAAQGLLLWIRCCRRFDTSSTWLVLGTV